MKTILQLIILTSIFYSCSTPSEVEKGGINFTYSDMISKAVADSISTYFVSTKQNESMKWVGLEKVNSVKIDSAYYSYLLYLNVSDLDTVLKDKMRKARYQAFAKFLSEDVLDSTRVHVFLTDDSFEVKEGLPYDPKAFVVIDTYYTYTKGKAVVHVTGGFERVVPRGLYDEFYINKPEMFKSADTLHIEIGKKKDNTEVNILIDPKEVDVNALLKQFDKSDPLIYDVLFSYQPTYFNIVDKGIKENLKVIAHGISN
ncbi:hypothetical protein ACFSRY_19165 [Pontibacter locisalis]|uniref:DUF4296 domain-containing protein n=1 Tax=Pontibacter locisalis TaxID=1719035 RepID=A0ABW5IQY6_9BACT